MNKSGFVVCLNIHNLHKQTNFQNAHNLKWFIISFSITNSQFTETFKWVLIGTYLLLRQHNRKKPDVWSKLPSWTLFTGRLSRLTRQCQTRVAVWDCPWHVQTGESSWYTCSRPVIECRREYIIHVVLEFFYCTEVV